MIENPEPRTYVGRNPEGHADSVTLQLGIASDFERVTFNKEFYGRQFALISGKLVTSVPWTPGRHELQFSYVVRNDGRHRVWTRPARSAMPARATDRSHRGPGRGVLQSRSLVHRTVMER